MLRPASESDCRELARAFAERVADDAGKAIVAMREITMPLLADVKTRGAPASSAIAKAARAWAALPRAGQVTPPTIKRSKSRRELLCRDFRLICGRITLPGAHELPRDSISVVMTEMSIKPGNMAFEAFAAVTIQQHALSRYFQRAPDPSEATLRAEIAALAEAYDELTELAGTTPDHGFQFQRWVGEAFWTRGTATLLCRTYLPATRMPIRGAA